MTLSFEDGASISFKDKAELVEFIKTSSGMGDSSYSVDTFYLIICAGMVFLMQV